MCPCGARQGLPVLPWPAAFSGDAKKQVYLAAPLPSALGTAEKLSSTRISVWAPTLCQNARVHDDSHFPTCPLKSACGFFCFRQVVEETYDPKTCHDPGQMVELSFCWAGYHLSLQEGRDLRVKVK